MKDTEHLVNLQLLAEDLQRRGIDCDLRAGGEMQGLRGIKFYEPERQLQEDFLVLCLREQGGPLPPAGNLLLLGDWEGSQLPPRANCLTLPQPPELGLLFNLLADLFVFYESIEQRLRQYLQMDGSLKKICDLWLEEFGTDIFVHDQSFCILACPRHIAGMPPFEYNEQIGYYMQDSMTLTQFRTSPAYQQTLKTQGGSIWESDFDAGTCMYANIWFEGSYHGRMIVLDQHQTEGKLRLVEYFGMAVTKAIENRYLFRNDAPEPLRPVMMEAIHGESIDQAELAQKVQWMGWDIKHHYVCAVITFGQEAISRYIVVGVCNAIQRLVKGCYTCYYQDAIYLLANLTVSRLTMGEFRTQIAQLVREAILHMGVSHEFYDLRLLPDYLAQARLEERYARDSRFTSWYNEFHDHALQYWLHQGTRELAPHCLVSNALNCLKEYDTQNGTDLYQTLKVYLMVERNATLTSQTLEIHRSTLPHRLSRIKELTGTNLDDFKTRLYLLMSYALEELERNEGI